MNKQTIKSLEALEAKVVKAVEQRAAFHSIGAVQLFSGFRSEQAVVEIHPTDDDLRMYINTEEGEMHFTSHGQRWGAGRAACAGFPGQREEYPDNPDDLTEAVYRRGCAQHPEHCPDAPDQLHD